MRITVRPSVEGTTRATIPIPQASQATTTIVVRNPAD